LSLKKDDIFFLKVGTAVAITSVTEKNISVDKITTHDKSPDG